MSHSLGDGVLACGYSTVQYCMGVKRCQSGVVGNRSNMLDRLSANVKPNTCLSTITASIGDRQHAWARRCHHCLTTICRSHSVLYIASRLTASAEVLYTQEEYQCECRAVQYSFVLYLADGSENSCSSINMLPREWGGGDGELLEGVGKAGMMGK